MKIAFFETQGWEEKYVNEKLGDQEIRYFNEPLTPEIVSEIKDYEVVSTFIYSKLDIEVLGRLPNLKFIATRSTSFDHIDIDECNKRGIYICNVPVYGENTVAEHTFALILSLTRNLNRTFQRQSKEDYRLEGLKGFDLHSKTLGVIGTGPIGTHVIKIAKGFGMNVIAYDHHPKETLPCVLNYKYVDLNELLKTSDVITIHVPHTQHTHHLINLENINIIKKGAILINTSRGGIIENKALIKALDEGIVSNAGLDVIEGEAPVAEEKQILYHPETLKTVSQLAKQASLLNRENVVITPHIGFYSQETLEKIINCTIENIEEYIRYKTQ